MGPHCRFPTVSNKLNRIEIWHQLTTDSTHETFPNDQPNLAAEVTTLERELAVQAVRLKLAQSGDSTGGPIQSSRSQTALNTSAELSHSAVCGSSAPQSRQERAGSTVASFLA